MLIYLPFHYTALRPSVADWGSGMSVSVGSGWPDNAPDLCTAGIIWPNPFKQLKISRLVCLSDDYTGWIFITIFQNKAFRTGQLDYRMSWYHMKPIRRPCIQAKIHLLANLSISSLHVAWINLAGPDIDFSAWTVWPFSCPCSHL